MGSGVEELHAGMYLEQSHTWKAVVSLFAGSAAHTVWAIAFHDFPDEAERGEAGGRSGCSKSMGTQSETISQHR
jgi:hypothetical protein